jgi:hypothetical protein
MPLTCGFGARGGIRTLDLPITRIQGIVKGGSLRYGLAGHSMHGDKVEMLAAS